VSALRLIAGLLVCLLACAPVAAADRDSEASPFIYAPSALAPAAPRGWVVLLPGGGELGFRKASAHYEKVALLLNANGFDTLIVPYEEAYDEDLDGEPDSEGERIAAVTMRAVQWMRETHPDSENEPGAVVAWGEGARGLLALAATGSNYPLPNLVASVAFYPDIADEAPFNSRLPLLMQIGSEDESVRDLRRYIGEREAGSVEPDLAVQDDAKHGFDIERFAKPKTVRSTPLIGATVTFAYNAAAAHAAQQKMLTFLKARLEAPE
jgi:dienelactone hydrolase